MVFKRLISIKIDFMKFIYPLLFLVGFVSSEITCHAQIDSCTLVVITPSPNAGTYRILNSSGYVIFQSNQSFLVDSICLQTDCYTIHPNPGWNGNSLHIEVEGWGVYEGTLSSHFGVNVNCGTTPVYGCSDPLASNYNLWANFQVPCIYIGCDDPLAYNYNPLVTIPDNSCMYCEDGIVADVYLCTYAYGYNNSLAIVNGSGDTIFQSPVLGDSQVFNSNVCLHPGDCYTALLENITDTADWNGGYFYIHDNNYQYIYMGLEGVSSNQGQFSIDGSCGSTFGCTQPTALNYDSTATFDDGSCVFACMGYTMNIAFYEGAYLGAHGFSIADSTGFVLLDVPYASVDETSYYTVCVSSGCYSVNMTGGGWQNSPNSSGITISCTSGQVQIFSLPANQTWGTQYFGVNMINCGTPTEEPCTADIALLPYDASQVPNTVFIVFNSDLANANSVTWTFGDGLSTTNFYPWYYYDSLGTYDICVHIIYSNGCNVTSCISLTPEILASYFPNGTATGGFQLRVIQNIAQTVETLNEMNEGIVAFPNPCSEILNLSLPLNHEITPAQIQVVAMDGTRLDLVKKIHDSTVTVVTDELAAGIYLVTIQNGTSVWTRTFVKN